VAHHMIDLDHDGLTLLHRTAKFVTENLFD
jgi:hypothetical protein